MRKQEPIFKELVEKVLKEQKITLSASEKNMILNAVSWYDETAQKLIKKISKISGDKLEKLCENLGCKESELSDFGYYPTGKKDEFVEYGSDTDLRDSENIPLKDDIYQYFLKEVKPHVMSVVPRLLEKVYDKIYAKGADLSGIKKRLFFWATGLGIQFKPYKENGVAYPIRAEQPFDLELNTKR